MDHGNAENFWRWCTEEQLVRQRRAGISPHISFVTPIVSATVAAACTRNQLARELPFANSDCMDYAETTGLTLAMKGLDPVGQAGGLHGQTYSRLTKLYNHAQVNTCNKVIADVIYAQLEGPANGGFVDSVVKVVGELHDNVPSHANGSGFSAAQVYDGERLQFAVADCGCGMLTNVQKSGLTIDSHVGAIEWCLQRGNTTAKPRDEWAQRVPDEAGGNVLPDGVEAFVEDNHHIGEGLWRLTELARRAGGCVWIWSGDCSMLIGPDDTTTKRTAVSWPGVAIEIEFDVSRARELISRPTDGSAAIAEGFGI